jgi:exodeoxyribonuclease V alpha subunit
MRALIQEAGAIARPPPRFKCENLQGWRMRGDRPLSVVVLRAITIHKSQGSEYPVVILPLFTQHYMMLSRNLLYTALTRAKKLTLLVGQKKAVAIAINQVRDRERYTQLDHWIQAWSMEKLTISM